MPGPYTAFDFGGPVVSPAYISEVAKSFLYGDPSSLPDAFPIPFAEDLIGGVVGTAYSVTISATGGTSPYTFSVLSGSLPTSTSLNSSTGVISGTPTVAGTYTFTIKVTDANGLTGSTTFEIIIASGAGGGGGSFTFVS